MRSAHPSNNRTTRIVAAVIITVIFALQALTGWAQRSVPNSLSPEGTGTASPVEPQGPGYTYFGYEISVGAQYQTFTSQLQQIHNLPVTELGARAGVRIANTIGALRAFAGLHYADANVPYTIDMLEGGLSSQVYLLRLNKRAYHTLEPYAGAGIIYQQAQFYGTYLSTEHTNKSVSEEPYLGHVSWLQAHAALGIEYQLESESQHFLHFFLEARAGTPFLFHASNRAFAGTEAETPIGFQFGVSFGKFR